MSEDISNPAHDELSRAKSVLRLKARAARRTVLSELRAAYSYAIAERVLNLPEIGAAASVLVYGATPEEVDVSVLEFALRERGVRIAYPRVAGPRTLALHWVDDPRTLVRGAFSLEEPTADLPEVGLGGIGAIIVPGVAFDADGNRLGFGGGYYDSLLASTESTPATIGVAYDEQMFDLVPHDERDRPVSVVVTPTRTLRPATR